MYKRQEVKTPVGLEHQQKQIAATNQSSSVEADPNDFEASSSLALVLLPLPLIGLGFLSWCVLSKRKKKAVPCEPVQSNATSQEPSHHSLSNSFIRASTINRKMANERSERTVSDQEVDELDTELQLIADINSVRETATRSTSTSKAGQEETLLSQI